MIFRYRAVACALAACACAATTATAATIGFSGELDIVFEDPGGAVYSGVPTGTTFSGEIDDASASGFITDGTTRTDFGCCAAAGGLEVTNDEPVSSDVAAVLNALQSVRTFVPGDVIDLIDLEGDAVFGDHRIEVGLSFVFDGATFSDDSLSSYPFDPADLLFSVFFIVEEDDWLGPDDIEIYNALGLVDTLSFGGDGGGGDDGGDTGTPGAIPLPPTFAFMIAGFGLLAAVRRRTS